MSKYRDPEFVMARVSAMQHVCPYCAAPPDEECYDPRTGYRLEHQPAHLMRLREAQVL